MTFPYDVPLLTDTDGYRYFVAELAAFKVFGPAFDELREQLDPMMKAWFMSPDRVPQLLDGVNRMRQIANEVSTEAQQQMDEIMRYVYSHDDPDVEVLVAEEESDEDDEPKLPHGQVKVLVGERRKKITDNQRRLFDWLCEHQRDLMPDVRASLTEVYREVREDELRQFGDAPWFALQMPEIVRGDELDATVRLVSVRLHPRANRLALVFDMLWEWHDYGDIAVTITNGKVDDGARPAYQLEFP
ncbi:MAG: hypothetical protein ACREHD_33435 [Pirellulales bacterium]